jgi:hypothetical protein
MVLIFYIVANEHMEIYPNVKASSPIQKPDRVSILRTWADDDCAASFFIHTNAEPHRA